jgi:hypothetical protein
MRLTCERLESRDTPSASNAGGGVVVLNSGARLSVYGGGWMGRLNVADLGSEVDIGPGPGGGPRFARLDPLTGARLVNDVFLGDPGDRSGLIPLAVGGPPADPGPVSFGPPDGYPLYLDRASNAVTAEVYRYFAPAGNVRVTNERPDVAPGDYATVLVGVRVPLDLGVVGTLGVADVGAVTRPHFSFVSPTAIAAPPNGSEVIAHEAGHLFGLVHVDDQGDIMSPHIRPPAAFSAAEVAGIHDAAAVGLHRGA